MKHNHKFSNKVVLQEIIQRSYSKAQVLKELNIIPCGGNYKTLDKYIMLYKIDTSHFTGKVWNQKERYRQIFKKKPIETFLVENNFCNTRHLKIRLLQENYKSYRCECCRLTEWNGSKIPLELDHINGINSDNRIENLRLLCPNCHAQTSTYRGKNRK